MTPHGGALQTGSEALSISPTFTPSTVRIYVYTAGWAPHGHADEVPCKFEGFEGCLQCAACWRQGM